MSRAGSPLQKRQCNASLTDREDGNLGDFDAVLRSVIIDEALSELYQKHHAWDNFHHEPPVARRIASFVPDQASVPANVAERLFKTVLICRVGNGVGYNKGVSPAARPIYDDTLAIAGDKFGRYVLMAVREQADTGMYGNQTRRQQAKLALVAARQNVINARLLECFDYLIDRIEADGKAPLSAEFSQLATAYMSSI